MITLKLCQKLPFKFDPFRTSSLPPSTSVRSLLPSTAHNSLPASGVSAISCRRCSCKASIQQLTVESRDLCSKERPHWRNSNYYVPQSITPYPFDDINTNDAEAATTRVQVLEQWNQLLENLKAIVKCLDCIATSVEDVSAIRKTLERHHLVKFFVKPYSYTAEDVVNFLPGEMPSEVSNLSGFPIGKESVPGGMVHGNNTPSNTDMIDIASYCSIASSSVVDVKQSCITQLEQESLLAVKVLSNGLWKDGCEAHPAQCDIPDMTYANSTELQESDASCVMLCERKDNKPDGKKDPDDCNRPNQDQLNAVQDYMASNLPKIFMKFHSYDIYTDDVIFENNWYFDQSYVTVGTTAYALEIAKLRLFVHLRYANVKMQLLKITTSELDGTVRIRWRITGIPQVKAIMFWKFFPWTNQSHTADDSEWLDGFSTFFVNGKGLIYKHRMDRIVPDEGLKKKKVPTATLR